MDHLRRGVAGGKQISIAQWNSFFTFDTICRVAFSEDEGLVEKQQDLGDILKAGRARFEHWHYWQAFPRLERLMFKNRFAARVPGTSPLAQIASDKVQTRLSEDRGLGSHQDLSSIGTSKLARKLQNCSVHPPSSGWSSPPSTPVPKPQPRHSPSPSTTSSAIPKS
jgi:hypothetical protein